MFTINTEVNALSTVFVYVRINVHYASFCWFVFSGDFLLHFVYKAFGM